MRRPLALVAGAAGALLLALALYLALGGLSRYQDRVETWLARETGRSFAIDGEFRLRLLPTVSVLAERVRLGNADWGSAPQMLEAGRVSARICLASLLAGRLEICDLELRDVSLVLERGRDGRGNWVFGDPAGPGAAPPLVVRNGSLRNARIAFLESGGPERVMPIEALDLARSGSVLELEAPSLDLTPLFAGARGGRARAERFVFDEAPLPLDALRGRDVGLRVVLGELRLGAGSLQDVEATLLARDGRLTLDARAKGGVSGTLVGTLAIAPADKGRAEANLTLVARDLRTGVEAGDAIAPHEAPATSVEAGLRASGTSLRQMAASADGHVLLTQGPGKVETGILDLFGSDVLGQLARKLNPFSADDPYSQLECTVLRARFAGGRAVLDPVLFQTGKVAVAAQGGIDLRTEALEISFATRPRKGIGISAGLFTNPFVDLGGTLADPRLGVGARGATAGAAAVVTGGASVLAQALLERLRGAQDRCEEVRAAASAAR